MFRKLILTVILGILVVGVFVAYANAGNAGTVANSQTTAPLCPTDPPWFRWEAVALVIFGASAAVAMAGIGSAMGIARSASVGLGAMQEDAGLFLPSLVLSALPGTQGIYGFIIGFLALKWSGVFGGNTSVLTINAGWNYFFAAMPVAFAGMVSAVFQGKVCASGIQLAAREPSQWTRGMIMAVFVEFYAILGFLASILVLSNIKG